MVNISKQTSGYKKNGCVSVAISRHGPTVTYIQTAAMLQHTTNKCCSGCWTNTAMILRLYTSSKKHFHWALNIISESKRSADQTGHTNTHTHTHTHTCSNPTLTHRCQSNYTMLYLYNKPACSGNIHNTWQKVKTLSNDSVTQVLHEVRQVILFIVLLFLPQIWQCFQHGLHCEST